MELQLFSKGTWNIGCPIILGEIPWFKGRDVATSLKYTNPRRAVRDHVDDKDKRTLRTLLHGVTETVTHLNRQPHEVYVNESGLYCLTLRSRHPLAKSFKLWISSEVLPSVRSAGSQFANLFTAMNERLEKQEQTLSGQRQLLVDLEQRLLGSCSLAVAAVNGRLKDQDEKLTGLRADLIVRLKAQNEVLSAQGRLLSCIYSILDHGEPMDVDEEDVELNVSESECSASKNGSVAGEGASSVTCLFHDFPPVVNACRRFLDYAAKHPIYREALVRYGLYRCVSNRRAGGRALKALRDLCFRRGEGPDELRKYGGPAVYGKYSRAGAWRCLLDKMLEEGLVDEVADGVRKTRLTLNIGPRLGSKAGATLRSWRLCDSAIAWLTLEC